MEGKFELTEGVMAMNDMETLEAKVNREVWLSVNWAVNDTVQRLSLGVQPPEPDLPRRAWKVTNNSGDIKRVIVGKHFNHDERIEIHPDDLMEDPDSLDTRGAR